MTGRLVGRGTVAVNVRMGGVWTARPLEEPSERDLPGTFGVLLAPGRTGGLLRLTLAPSDAHSVVLRDLRLDALAPPATAQAAAAPSGTLPGIAVISRLGWGNPDGEGSPRWIPFYQQPFHIIIHHTAEPPGPSGPIADMQAIWHFHTFDRRWGDIGYNYVIDTAGRIYEGRAGGDQVVGGHTQGFNPGAIGIALIGDYNSARPSAPMVRALRSLITALANRYGIDALADGTDNGLRFDLLGGHRDFNQTDCPGIYAYALLPALRASVARAVHSGVALAGAGIADVAAGSPSTVLLTVRNTGTTTWNGRFSLRLRGAPPYGLPARYNLPDTPPGGQVIVPLFLPSLPAGTVRPLKWQLYDAAGVASGTSVAVTLDVRPAATSPVTSTPPPSNTPPAMATAQPSPATATPVATLSMTAIPTSSSTPTATSTASATPSASSTPSASATPTPSPTLTHAITAAPTATSTHVPTTKARGTDTPVPPLSQRLSGGMMSGSTRLSASVRRVDAATLARDTQIRVARDRAGAAVAAAPTTIGTPVAGLAPTWYFAAGSSAQRERETIAVLNTGPRAAYLVATLLREDGRRVSLVGEAPPEGRATLDVGFAAGRGDSLGVVLRSTQPVLAERAVSHASPTLDGSAATLTPGYATPAPVWYLPRLPMARDEKERLSLLNPDASGITVGVSAVVRGRLQPFKQLRLAPLSVRSLALPTGVASAEVRVVGPAGAGIVAEAQTLYSAGRGATVVAGLPALRSEGYLPGPSGGTHDYAMLFNPHPAPAYVTLAGLDSSGRAIAVRRLEVPAGGQAAVDLASGAMDTRRVLLVRSSLPIAAGYAGLLGTVAEPALSAIYHGSAVAAWAQPARTIRFAEGDTRLLLSNPREALTITNTSLAPAQLSIDLASGVHATSVHAITLAARATVRLNLNGIGAPDQHGLILHASVPVVAWHSIDLNRGAIRLLSPGIAGA